MARCLDFRGVPIDAGTGNPGILHMLSYTLSYPFPKAAWDHLVLVFNLKWTKLELGQSQLHAKKKKNL